jgi:hypothetical protein
LLPPDSSYFRKNRESLWLRPPQFNFIFREEPSLVISSNQYEKYSPYHHCNSFILKNLDGATRFLERLIGTFFDQYIKGMWQNMEYNGCASFVLANYQRERENINEITSMTKGVLRAGTQSKMTIMFSPA